jgi:hypothetical protein
LPAQGIFHPHRKTGATHLHPAIEENSYSITRWSATELVAERRQGCDLLTLTIGLQPEEVSLRSLATPDCRKEILDDPRLSRVISAKLIDGTTANNQFYEKKAAEVRSHMAR